MFDAYTVKKVLPRLVIAVILIQLSWFIFTGMIALMNSIAYGLEALIYIPFGGGSDNFTLAALIGGLDSSATGVFTTAAIGVAVTAFAGGVGAVLLAIVIALIVSILALTIRRMLLILLLIISPLALVAWILPNTERFWKMWWDNFSKLLLMYPLILIMIASGRVFAKIASTSDSSDIINVAIILGGYFLPLILIPKTFKMAGNAFATIGGSISSSGEKGRGALGTWGKEKWGNTRWGLRKQGKKDAKLNVRKQRETATAVSKAIEGKGLSSQIYKRVGMKPADRATLESSADKALIDSQAQGYIHGGMNAEQLVEIAATTNDRQEAQAALKALAMQGEGVYLMRAAQQMAATGKKRGDWYDQSLRSNYGEFAGAGAGATQFISGETDAVSLAAKQGKKILGQSDRQLANMGQRQMFALHEVAEVTGDPSIISEVHGRLDASADPAVHGERKVKTADMPAVKASWDGEKSTNETLRRNGWKS